MPAGPLLCPPVFARRCPPVLYCVRLFLPAGARRYCVLTKSPDCATIVSGRAAVRAIGAERALSLIFLCSGLQAQASHSASSAPDHAHHAPAGGTSGELASEYSQTIIKGAPKDDKPTGSLTVVGVETVVRSSITCATICPILHFDNFTMRSFRSPIGAVEHHDLFCAELIVNSHGAAASPAMMT